MFHSHNHRYKKKIFIPFIILAVMALATTAVMLLWNAILPDIISGATQITFWQAGGLLILTRILFGGFHKSGKHHSVPPYMKEKFMNMTEEEKAKLRAEWKRRCCITDDGQENKEHVQP